MHYDVLVESMDHFGRGVAHINGKTIFILQALPGEVVDIQIMQIKKNYEEAIVVQYKKKSVSRIPSVCPYFDFCGGCQLLFYEYPKTCDFKKNKVMELIHKNKIHYSKEIEVIKNDSPLYYRNKIELKIVNGKVGFYKENTHVLVEIKKCMVANQEINKVLLYFSFLHIQNGSLTIRVNTNQEVLLIIYSSDNYEIELDKLKEVIKLVGIVYNDKTIYGENFFYERIGGFLFKVSYNAFFQVNPFICSELFKLVDFEIKKDSTVLDLYSGVGTLSLVASKKAKQVVSVEIIKNAVINGIFNAKLNKRENIQFLLGDVGKIVDKIKYSFDTFILDPPRKGLDKKTIEFIKEKQPHTILYISCDANTLMRDLKDLEEDYEIKSYKILDMFSYSYHLESFVVLKNKEE